MGPAKAVIELGNLWHREQTAGALLAAAEMRCRQSLDAAADRSASDRSLCPGTLEQLSGRSLPAHHAAERGRLIDALVDAHKYVFGKRVAVYGEPDLVVGLAGMLAEIGMVPALCATGAETRWTCDHESVKSLLICPTTFESPGRR